MILALDHLSLAATDPAAAAAVYRGFLGVGPHAGNRFQLANMVIALVPAADGTAPGLAAACFAVADLDRATALLRRRGLSPAEDNLDGRPAVTVEIQGLTLRFLAHGNAREPAPPGKAGAVTGLDHVVVRTANPDRAIALFAGRLGLDLRLDRTFADWGTRLLFFRCGDLVIEVAHDLKAGTSDNPDSLWGLSWRTDDLQAAHARLARDGTNLSAIRTGRRPGTRVFTARGPGLIVPSLVLGIDPKEKPGAA